MLKKIIKIIMKVLNFVFVAIGIVTVFLIFIQCMSQRLSIDIPIMTKWIGEDCELYVIERPLSDKINSSSIYPSGIFVFYSKNGKKHVYDAEISHQMLYIYEHRENPDDVVCIVACYYLKDVSKNYKKVKYYLGNQNSIKYYLPETLKLKLTEKNINMVDVPYKLCYGNPNVVMNKCKKLETKKMSNFYLNISDDNTTGILTWKDMKTWEKTEYNVIFDSKQIMTVYDKCTNEKIVSYYMFCQSPDMITAIMEEKFDKNCTWEEILFFIEAK